jgi:hypothetical protein
MGRYGRWSEADIARLTGQKLLRQLHDAGTGSRPRKFRNIPTVYAGLQFDSKREAERAQELMLMEKAGLITDLVLDKRQLRYSLMVNGQNIGTYTADSQYREHGILVVEDVKSKPTKTREYRRTKKLMLALYGIEIREVY